MDKQTRQQYILYIIENYNVKDIEDNMITMNNICKEYNTYKINDEDIKKVLLELNKKFELYKKREDNIFSLLDKQLTKFRTDIKKIIKKKYTEEDRKKDKNINDVYDLECVKLDEYIKNRRSNLRGKKNYIKNKIDIKTYLKNNDKRKQNYLNTKTEQLQKSKEYYEKNRDDKKAKNKDYYFTTYKKVIEEKKHNETEEEKQERLKKQNERVRKSNLKLKQKKPIENKPIENKVEEQNINQKILNQIKELEIRKDEILNINKSKRTTEQQKDYNYVRKKIERLKKQL